MVGNPEDKFSHNKSYTCKYKKLGLKCLNLIAVLTLREKLALTTMSGKVDLYL